MTKPNLPRHPQTLILHPAQQAPAGFASNMFPVQRASTILFPNSKTFTQRHSLPAPYVYGLMGTETSRNLELAVAANEGGADASVVPSGLAALMVVNFAILKSGDHVLIGDNGYGPNAQMFDDVLAGLGVTYSLYNPLDLAALPALFQSNTKLVWLESPGSHTLEVSDMPAVAAITHAKGALLAVDHTWSAGVLLDVFACGADIAIQAMSKYQGGHSDVLMGSIVWRDAALGKRLLATRNALGIGVSADDCVLMLRGMQTMHVRLKECGVSALHLAKWLAQQPQIGAVLHPALPSCPGHDVFMRDFKAPSALFSFSLKPHFTSDDAHAVVDALQLFGIGVSWGGTHSLALHVEPIRHVMPVPQGALIRVSVGLEHIDDLIADMENALNVLKPLT